MIPIPSGTALRYQTSTAGTYTIVPQCEGTIYSVVQQSDSKIIFVGNFTTINGVSNARGITRLNSNGSVDTLFNTNAGTGATGDSGSISDVVLQSDGKIIVIGPFTLFNGSTATRIARLNSDGTLDTAFMTNIGTGPTTSKIITSIALQPDGKIVLSGTFESWNGVTSAGEMVRLNFDGTRDSSFAFNDPSDVLGNINAMAVQSDGKIVIVGDISEVKGTACNGVARLNSDGSVDTAFTTAVQGPYDSENSPTLNDVAIQSDGKIIIVGVFPQWIVNSVAEDAGAGIVRLNSDGTVQFRGTSASYSNSCVYIQSDGSFLVGGSESLVRVTSGGTISSNFGPGSGQNVYDVIQLSSGDIFAVGGFSEWQGNTSYGGFIKINSTTLAVSMSDFNPLPDLVFAIVVGGGGRGNVTAGCGGGAGAIVYGLVPKSSSVTVGAGGQIAGTPGNGGDPSTYSTLYGAGGGGGAFSSIGFGAGTTGPAGTTVAGSTLMYAVGGSGGASVTSTGNIAGSAGGSGTSGGGGGGATNSASGGTTTGGIGGSGFIGGGGGAARITASSSSAATAGAGGAGVYAGGTGGQLTGTSLKYCGGGGGGGYLGVGANGTASATATSAFGGNGGLGGGGGGGSGNNGVSQGGNGGTGCVLLYW